METQITVVGKLFEVSFSRPTMHEICILEVYFFHFENKLEAFFNFIVALEFRPSKNFR